MKNQSFENTRFFRFACYFEGSLIIIALFLGWMTDTDPVANLFFSEKDLAIGVLLTIPLIIIFFMLQQLQFAPIQKIKQLQMKTLGPCLSDRHWTDLFILATIVGFSEEMLFRGFLQPWLENSLNMTTGLIVSNLIFAIVHWVTPLYALLALLIGIYLGIALDYEGEPKLLIPIVIHTLYDFVAFMVILRNYRNI